MLLRGYKADLGFYLAAILPGAHRGQTGTYTLVPPSSCPHLWWRRTYFSFLPYSARSRTNSIRVNLKLVWGHDPHRRVSHGVTDVHLRGHIITPESAPISLDLAIMGVQFFLGEDPAEYV